jgi:hypothetical protein
MNIHRAFPYLFEKEDPRDEKRSWQEAGDSWQETTVNQSTRRLVD